jgi:iron uptake system EfeUOB component EfeO/EfeM
MDEEDVREFMERDSGFQERLRETDFSGFSRWEERFLITHHSSLDSDEMAERLDRDTEEIGLKLHAMGLKTDEF